MTDEQIRAVIAANEWKFAKTMPHIPHWYAVTAKAPDRAAFVAFAVHARKHGYQKMYGRRMQTYFEIDGYKYWTMDPTPEVCAIINRAKVE